MAIGDIESGPDRDAVRGHGLGQQRQFGGSTGEDDAIGGVVVAVRIKYQAGLSILARQEGRRRQALDGAVAQLRDIDPARRLHVDFCPASIAWDGSCTHVEAHFGDSHVDGIEPACGLAGHCHGHGAEHYCWRG